MADDKLSRLASAIWRANGGLHEGYDDVDAWGAPHECYGLVARGYGREVSQLLRDAEMTAVGYNDLLEERTSSRFAFYSGLYIDETLVDADVSGYREEGLLAA